MDHHLAEQYLDVQCEDRGVLAYYRCHSIGCLLWESDALRCEDCGGSPVSCVRDELLVEDAGSTRDNLDLQ